MIRHLIAMLLGAAGLIAGATAADLPAHARLGVIDAIAPHVSAGFGTAADSKRAPTIADTWQLGQVAADEAVRLLDQAGYRAELTTLPEALARTVRSGGALAAGGNHARLALGFSHELERWLRTSGFDGVVVLRSLARPLDAHAPAQSGYGIAHRGGSPVAYANLAPLLIRGPSPTIAGALPCLITVPVNAAIVGAPKTLSDLAPVRPPVEDVLRQSIRGALILAGVGTGDARCE